MDSLSNHAAPTPLRELLRRRLLQRRAALAVILEDVLARKDRTAVLEALGLRRPGVRPEQTLCEAIKQVEQRRILLVSDFERYCRCNVCGAALDSAALEQAAWADRCAMHSAA